MNREIVTGRNKSDSIHGFNFAAQFSGKKLGRGIIFGDFHLKDNFPSDKFVL